MRHSTIVKRCEKVRFLISKFTDFMFETDSKTLGCFIVTFRYDSNLRFIRETDVSDILAAKKILGAYNFIIDCNSSMISFFYE